MLYPEHMQYKGRGRMELEIQSQKSLLENNYCTRDFLLLKSDFTQTAEKAKAKRLMKELKMDAMDGEFIEEYIRVYHPDLQ